MKVVVVGGGIIGSAIAYFLAARAAFRGSVTVIERDPSYAKCATSLSVGGIRQQFSTPENIEMSKYSAGFVKNIAQHLSVDGEYPEVAFVESGYLFLATAEGMTELKKKHDLVKARDLNVVLLSPHDLEQRFPWLQVGDLAGGTLGLTNEGWLDPFSLMLGFKHKAESLAVTFVQDEVIDLTLQGGKITATVLKNQGNYPCEIVVNAAGPNANRLAHMAGLSDFPVHSRKRMVYAFDCRSEIPDCPLVIDPSGVYFRPEGEKFVCGVSPPSDQDPDSDDFEIDYHLFEEIVWPVLAHRVPAFEAIKLASAWAGHYSYNVLDQNAILGPHPDISNFIFANGFSGHGVQQSPAVGRAISELITFGSYQTLNLSRLGYERFAAGQLLREINVI